MRKSGRSRGLWEATFVALLTCALTVASAQAFVPFEPFVAIEEEASGSVSGFQTKIDEAKAMMMTDPRAALAAAAEADMLTTRLPYDTRSSKRAEALWLKAEAYLRTGMPEQGAPVAEAALELLSNAPEDDALRADIMLCRGRIASRLSQTELAARSYFDAHELFVALGNTRKESMALQAIGSIYRDAESFEKALEFYQRAEDVYEAADPVVALSLANNRANILMEMGDFERARDDFLTALDRAEEIDSQILFGRIVNNLAGLEAQAGNLDLAEGYTEEAFAALDTEEGAEWRRFVHRVKAQIAVERGDYEEARRQIEAGLEGIDITQTSLTFEEMHMAAHRVYAELGQWEEAYAHLRAYKRLADEAKVIASSANLAILGARFQFAEQQLNIERLRIEQLRKEQELAEADRRQGQQRLIIASGSLALLFAFFTAAGAWSNKRRVARINSELSATVGQLADEIEQRETVEKDLIAAKEEAEQADRMKSTFLATMSHELRTPMNGILGFTEVLLQSELNEETREQIEIIDSSGRSLLTLINDILDLSQIEAGGLKLRSSAFGLRPTVENSIKLLRAKAQEKNLGLVAHIDPRVPAQVFGDEDRVRQIIINLVGNAIKFTSAGAVTMAVRLGEKDGGIRFVVTDTGIGIPKEKQDRLFKRFSQIDDGKSRKYEGSGLGLSICQELVQAMGGTIGCESEPGQGSTFFFEVPLFDTDEVTIPKAARRVVSEDAPLIAIVDDIAAKRDLVGQMVSEHDVRLETMTSAKDALTELPARIKKGADFAAIFISEGMGVTEARALVQSLRLHGVPQSVPFVFYGGTAEKSSQPFGDRDFVVSHPIFDHSIATALQAVLSGEGFAPRTAPERKARKTADVVSISEFDGAGRVLIVDDVAANRKLVEAVLGKMGVETVTAANGEEAVDLAGREVFGAILMDVYMPIMDGIEATKRIRSGRGPNADATIFALTASATEEEKKRTVDAGMDGVIGKPIDFAHLRSSVLGALGVDTQQNQNTFSA